MESAPEEAGSADSRSSPHDDITPSTTEQHNSNANSNPNPTDDPIDGYTGDTRSLSQTSEQSRPVSSVVPPYWQRHDRNASRASQSSLAGSAMITLEDHAADPECETSRGLWAQSVLIEDHVVVHGKTGVGAYVVWNCRIQTLDVSLTVGGVTIVIS